MNKQEFMTIMRNEFRKHDLLEMGWKFQWSKGKKQLGYCKYNSKKTVKVISVSSFWLEHGDKELVIDTLLHEIAHALDVEERGYSAHDKNWRKWCKVTGAMPNRTKNTVDIIPSKAFKYTLKCPNHGTVGMLTRMQKGSSYICRDCKSKIEIIQNY